MDHARVNLWRTKGGDVVEVRKGLNDMREEEVHLEDVYVAQISLSTSRRCCTSRSQFPTSAHRRPCTIMAASPDIILYFYTFPPLQPQITVYLAF
jgi:hypothetical protein